MEAGNREAHYKNAQSEQCGELWPENIEADALQENPANDHEHESQRIQQTEILNHLRHVRDGENKSGEQHRWKKEKEGRHHRLLLGLADG